jgi:hypothetical protein
VNRLLLENCVLPSDMERQIGTFVGRCNDRRYHDSQGGLVPAVVYHGRGATILRMREEIKKQTIQKSRLPHQSNAA